MKSMKIAACVALVVAALVYAGAPPVIVGGLAFKAPKNPATTIVYTNGWIVITCPADFKESIALDKTSPLPKGQNIAIWNAKAFKGSFKVAFPAPPGILTNVVYGRFTSLTGLGPGNVVTNFDVLELCTPPKSFSVSLKGVTIGTVIAKMTAPKADNIKNALLTEIKVGKGVALSATGKAPEGALGNAIASGFQMGFLGVPPELNGFNSFAPMKTASGRIGKAIGKGSIAYLNIWAESIPAINGKAKASLSTKIMGTGASAVHALAPGGATNSMYKVGKGQAVTYDLAKP